MALKAQGFCAGCAAPAALGVEAAAGAGLCSPSQPVGRAGHSCLEAVPPSPVTRLFNYAGWRGEGGRVVVK